jgi:hypothetical protein
MTGSQIIGNNNCTFKGWFWYCKFWGRCSVAITDSDGNSKYARNLHVLSGNNMSDIKLISNKTTATNLPGLEDVEIIAPGWGTSEEAINVDNYISNVPRGRLKIAKNTSGNVKLWYEADLIQ